MGPIICFPPRQTIFALVGYLEYGGKMTILRLVTTHITGCIGFVWQGFGSSESYRGGFFCEKLLEASPMSDRANASQLQDGPTAGQGRAHQ